MNLSWLWSIPEEYGLWGPFILYGFYRSWRFLREKPLRVGAYDNLIKDLEPPQGREEAIDRTIRPRTPGMPGIRPPWMACWRVLTAGSGWDGGPPGPCMSATCWPLCIRCCLPLYPGSSRARGGSERWWSFRLIWKGGSGRGAVGYSSAGWYW
uniref:Uncharacterized protein n=1 Tax=Candidatus Kentrum sp. LPFa TaxID=2126335 RepID=A0A450WLU2_9GAMM|nr:MAG: hypothetical protein BECKLPF1236A_GA0070988_101873 [Candidatus Kentron sp. LPFa]VFK33282.1 MAG: hypothetical protein BECKLPF1236C_GA0070990_102003 [Candidatus Kentron sp. LPFa]